MCTLRDCVFAIADQFSTKRLIFSLLVSIINRFGCVNKKGWLGVMPVERVF